jgi:phage terminase Nu1 subunit (DNA packaging protein)
MPIVSKTEYARLRGCAPSYVSKLLREGRITAIADGEHLGKIDSELADRQLEAARDPTKDGVRRRWQREKREDQETAALPLQGGGAAPGEPRIEPKDTEGYYTHKAKREKYDAALAQLRYLEQVGRLVSAEDVEREYDAIARSVRDALLNIPDRLAPIVAAETDPARVHALIAEEMRVALNELSRRLDEPAASGGTPERTTAH